MADGRQDSAEAAAASVSSAEPTMIKKVVFDKTKLAIPKAFLPDPLPPLTWVGKDLSKWVLSIMAASIVALVVYLFYMERKAAADVADAYKGVLHKTGFELGELDRLAHMKLDLRMAKDRTDWQMSETSLQDAQGVLRVAARLQTVSATQNDQLRRCIPLPNDPHRNEMLDRCLEIVEQVERELTESLATAGAKVAGEFATKLLEHRQSLHQFWIQAAQLILLNLLLPVLTALLGYIFGRQHPLG